MDASLSSVRSRSDVGAVAQLDAEADVAFHPAVPEMKSGRLAGAQSRRLSRADEVDFPDDTVPGGQLRPIRGGDFQSLARLEPTRPSQPAAIPAHDRGDQFAFEPGQFRWL